MTVHQREQRISELRRQRDSYEDRAASFDALADLIENTVPEYPRYKPDWLTVTRQIRKDVIALRQSAERCDVEIERLQVHVAAAARFKESTT